MEKKEPVKISLPLFITIIVLLVAVISGIYVFMQNQKLDKEIAGLKEQISKTQTEKNELQEKLNKISDVTNNTNTDNSKDSNTSSNNNNTSVSFTDEQVKTALNEYWDLRISIGDEVLKKLARKGVLDYNDSETVEENWYATTKIKLDEYKKAMLNYVSEQEFNKTFRDYFKVNNDGYLGYSTEIGGPALYCIVRDVTKNGDKTYTAKTFSIEPDTADEAENETYNFTIKDYNGHCAIDSINKK